MAECTKIRHEICYPCTKTRQRIGPTANLRFASWAVWKSGEALSDPPSNRAWVRRIQMGHMGVGARGPQGSHWAVRRLGKMESTSATKSSGRRQATRGVSDIFYKRATPTSGASAILGPRASASPDVIIVCTRPAVLCGRYSLCDRHGRWYLTGSGSERFGQCLAAILCTGLSRQILDALEKVETLFLLGVSAPQTPRNSRPPASLIHT
jgi:hypothetical protein